MCDTALEDTVLEDCVPDAPPEAPPGRRGADQRRSHRPSREDVRERIEFTLRLLDSQAYKSQIKRLLKARYSIDARTCERYLSRARRLRATRDGEPWNPDKARRKAIDFWTHIVRGKVGTLRDQMFAQQQVQQLLGIRPADERGRDRMCGERAMPETEVSEILVVSREEANQILALPPPGDEMA
jgi:hypothetical protein